MTETGSFYTLIGVVSWGQGCAQVYDDNDYDVDEDDDGDDGDNDDDDDDVENWADLLGELLFHPYLKSPSCSHDDHCNHEDQIMMVTLQ